MDIVPTTTSTIQSATHYLTTYIEGYVGTINGKINIDQLLDELKKKIHTVDIFKDKLFAIETFNQHLKTVADEIGKRELLFEGAAGGTFEERAINMIQDISTHEFHNLRAKIIALKDFRDLAMEDSQPKSARLIKYINDTANAGRLRVINALRNAFGYSQIVGPLTPPADIDPEMSDTDIIHNVVALAFDPFDGTNLHTVNITPAELRSNVVKILKMVYADGAIASSTDTDGALYHAIETVKSRVILISEYSVKYTNLLLKFDPSPLKNMIVELIYRTNMMTRNTIDVIKKGLENILLTLPDNTSDAYKEITKQLGLMEVDKIAHGGKYMSQRFKHGRIPPIIKVLEAYMLTLTSTEHHAEIVDIISKVDTYREEIKGARGDVERILKDRKLLPYLGEDREDTDVYITHTIHTYKPTQSYPSAFAFAGMNIENSNSGSEYDPSEGENNGVLAADNKAEKEIINAWGLKRVDGDGGITSGSNNNGKDMKEGGGKRKQTRKRSNKKSKKSKKTKRMKKVKRTMKKNKGKKGKKASRKRR